LYSLCQIKPPAAITPKAADCTSLRARGVLSSLSFFYSYGRRTALSSASFWAKVELSGSLWIETSG
jgi:hypothetical protein